MQVGDDCHFVGSINYVLFGTMMRLCHDHLENSLFSYAAPWFTADNMLVIAIYKHEPQDTGRRPQISTLPSMGP